MLQRKMSFVSMLGAGKFKGGLDRKVVGLYVLVTVVMV